MALKGYDMPYDNNPEKRNAYMREYRARRASRKWETKRRGRKPVDLRLMTVWEFEWYKAFHLLRDGTQLPPDPTFVIVNEREARAQLRWWKKASLKEILGEMQPGTPPPFDELPTNERARAKVRWEMREWTALKNFAELERESEIAALERWLKPKETPALAERRKIWETLVQGRTYAVIEQACEEWKHLADVRRQGVSCFADHVLANAEEFLRMKHGRRGRRFPRSASADDSRLEYLARGMAGVMVGVSPMTAIERLRNMKHETGGPLWDEAEKRCRCWRHDLEASHRYWETLKRIQEEGKTP
jgi:hypothetical protein